MHELISLGAVWTAWYRGWHHSFRPLEAKELRTHPMEYRFHFGAKRDDVAEVIPAQITWMNEDADRWVFEPDVVITPAHLDEKVLKRWSEFLEDVLVPAIYSGRVTWDILGLRSGLRNYYEYAESLVASGKDVGNYLR